MSNYGEQKKPKNAANSPRGPSDDVISEVRGLLDSAKEGNRSKSTPRAPFNPSQYHFTKPEYNLKQEAFIKKFYTNSKVNKNKINQ